MSSKLAQMWRQAAKDLEFDIIAPFLLTLPSGSQIKAKVLVREFGASKGMLVITDYKEISPFLSELDREGYGFSTMSEPKEDEQYSRESFIEMLEDWGWAGEDSAKPSWLKGDR